jgi:hypothetical protein
MVVLRDFLLGQMKQLTTISNPTHKEWLLLAQMLVVRMCMFNKRRIDEVDELKVTDFAQRPDDVNEEILGTLNVTERTLVKRYIQNLLNARYYIGLKVSYLPPSDYSGTPVGIIVAPYQCTQR